MNEARELWLLVDEDDGLDAVLLECLRGGLEGRFDVVEVAREATAVGGVAEKLLRSLGSAVGGRGGWLIERLRSADRSPVAVVTSHPEDAAAMASLGRSRPVVIGIERRPEVGAEWRSVPREALLCGDEHAARSGRRMGRGVVVSGVPVEPWYQPVEDALSRREAAGFDPGRHVVLITASVLDEEDLTQLLVQLGLVRTELEVVFEVNDGATAEELRRMVPALGLAASLIPTGEAGADVWPLAHLIVGRGAVGDLWRSRAVGVPMLAAPARDDGEEEISRGLEASGTGRGAEALATLAVDLDLSLEPERWESMVARVGELRVEEPCARVAAAIVEAVEGGRRRGEGGQGLPKGLERIGGGERSRVSIPPEGLGEAVSVATVVRERGEIWARRAEEARRRGEEELAVEASKRAAHHREVLDRLLESLRDGDDGGAAELDVEEELESLRRRVSSTGDVEARLRHLEVEDELQALKKKLGVE